MSTVQSTNPLDPLDPQNWKKVCKLMIWIVFFLISGLHWSGSDTLFPSGKMAKTGDHNQRSGSLKSFEQGNVALLCGCGVRKVLSTSDDEKRVRERFFRKAASESWNDLSRPSWKLIYRNSQKHESTLLHTYVLNEFLTCYRSCTTKYFWKNSYRKW